ncbi:MAG: GSCFA domain-containing protein [Saprospiraceae bacterium]|nr:GSCFA domain-containing protein [Saprospiraceae bacterium]
MNLFTGVPQIKSHVSIGYEDNILLLGSCFSVVLGKWLDERKFNVIYNPFGTVYNPVSISKLLDCALKNQKPGREEVLEQNGVFYHFDFHSDVSALNPEEVLLNIENRVSSAFSFLQKTTFLCITLGTSIVYRRKDNNEVVANCHKVPATYFDKNFLTIEEMVSSLSDIITKLREKLPQLAILFTVSPVRHIKDGLIENNRSKSRLIEVAHIMTEKFTNIIYFPSYEIVTDQLRDYRFYEKDLIHPNEMAHMEICNYFSNTFFTEETKGIVQKTEKIKSAFHHRPQFENHIDYKRMCLSQLEEIQHLQNIFPSMDFRKEVGYFQRYS